MNDRLLKTACMALVAGVAIAMTSVAEATLITTTRDSADFSTATQYTGADLLTSSDWSTVVHASGSTATGVADGTLLKFSPGTNHMYYGWGSSLTDSIGWTVEVSYKITQAESTARSVLGLLASDNTNGEYNTLEFASDEITFGETDGGDTQLATDDFTDDFHTLRIAEPANGGTGDTHVWVDGQLASNTLSGLDHTKSRLFVGDMGRHQQDGEVLIKYVRVDKTGAFAPVPEPSTLVLLCSGAVLGLLVLRRRWRR